MLRTLTTSKHFAKSIFATKTYDFHFAETTYRKELRVNHFAESMLSICQSFSHFAERMLLWHDFKQHYCVFATDSNINKLHFCNVIQYIIYLHLQCKATIVEIHQLQ